ncbi:polyketide synthase [Apiospora arundinis]
MTSDSSDVPFPSSGENGECAQSTSRRAASSAPTGYTNGHTNGHSNGTTNGLNGANGPLSPTHPVEMNGSNATASDRFKTPKIDQDLYDFLVAGKDARAMTPSSRFNIDAFHDAHGKPGSITFKHGYYLDDVDLADFDRLILEVVRETFESAGEADFRGKNIGTYVGLFSEDWQDIQNRDWEDVAQYQLTGKADFMLSNRISYEYDLKGPSYNVKAACSSAGLGLHQALQSIRLGETTAAIVAGANLITAPGMSIIMSAQQALSPDGSCVSCIYIKRLDEAIRDGNPIRAVLRSSSCNADGRTFGVATPNAEAQEALIRQAYQTVGLSLEQTAMVECHGTGTVVGDPIEVNSIARCFGKRGIYVGSVKPNLGHSEAAAALTSICKSVLALENKTIIPNIKFVTPNPAIPWNDSNLKVPTEPLPWPGECSERISINSFGIGGSNAHFILDSAASFSLGPRNPQPLPDLVPPPKTLLLFSASHRESLEKSMKAHQLYLERHPARLDSMAFTLAERREHLKFRGFSVAGRDTSLQLTSNQKPVEQTANAAFIFTGQGAQWLNMGADLVRTQCVFSDSIDAMDQVLASIEHAPSWSLRDMILNCKEDSVMRSAEYCQPLCTALQIALVDLLRSISVVPSAVVGHSSGEIAAAYAAGALSMQEAIIVAFYRGHVCTNHSDTASSPGGMAAVGLGRDVVAPYLVPGVTIACENSADSVTVSGDVKPLEGIMNAIRNDHPEALVRRLIVDMAYHSGMNFIIYYPPHPHLPLPLTVVCVKKYSKLTLASADHMKIRGDIYRELIAGHLSTQTPKIPFYSSVRSTVLLDALDFSPQYWQDNLESPVLFRSAVMQLLSESSPATTILLEIGPHSALAGPLRQICKEQNVSPSYISTLRRGKNDTSVFLESLGQLYCSGFPLKYPRTTHAKVLSDLPPYSWHYDRSYWSDTRVSRNWRFQKYGAHDLLGRRILESSEAEPCWRNILRVANVPWLHDHVVTNDIVFPAAGYVAIAGEAVSQHLNAHKDGYTVREVHIGSAMLLRSDSPTELITTLRPKMLSAKLDSKWFEFAVSSHNGSDWVKHCWGLVISGRTSSSSACGQAPETFTRKVSTPRWYKTMSRVGLNYGPRFRGLSDINASVTENKSSTWVIDRQEVTESRYAIHPSTLDAIFQSSTVAQTRGIYRQLTKLSLPTYIDEFYVSAAPSHKILVNTHVRNTQSSANGYVGGELVCALKGLRWTPLDNGISADPWPPQAEHIQWLPDFDFVDAAQLVTSDYVLKPHLALAERLFVLCAASLRKQLGSIQPAQPHFHRYKAWLEGQIERMSKPGFPAVEDSAELMRLDDDKAAHLMQQILEQGRSQPFWPFVETVWRCYTNMADILEGRRDFLQIVVEDNLLHQLYDWTNQVCRVDKLFQLMGNTQPQLKVLEIGAGTGGFTSKVLEGLRSSFGERLYLSYTYTDISSGFFVQAQERFKDHAGMQYKVLDICRSPVEQGFEPGGYDLVIASNCLHATPVLTQTLKHCLQLLQPDGRLFLQELSPITQGFNFTMGLFSGWWLGAEGDGRVDKPFISPEEWDVKLREAGFAGIDSVSFDGKRPYHMNANMIARPAERKEEAGPGRITLLTHCDELGPLARETRQLLRSAGYEIDQCVWGRQLPPANQDVVSFLDVEGGQGPLLKDISEESWSDWLKLVETLTESVVLWLSLPAQVRCSDPHQAQMLGVARTMRAELAMDFATMELEHTGEGAASAVTSVMGKIRRSRRAKQGDVDPDLEYAWFEGTIHLSRFHWFPVQEALAETAARPDTKRLVVGQLGMLQSLQWRGYRLDALEPDQVRIRTTTTAMNFKNLMLALGIIEFPEEREGGIVVPGAEATGYVTERPARFCAKLPSTLSDEEAVTMPTVYFTVLICLLERARMRKGETILIQSAAGGVGIAAIHVARWIGADIYVTTGMEKKADFLRNEFGIPSERIFNSRDESFLQDVMRATNGRGVDVVLNSLSGELLHASWKCVAAGGCMVEIGKRDMIGHGRLALDHFEDNRTFSCVDATTAFEEPQRLLEQMMKLYGDGHIQPIRPMTLFDAGEVEHAFRYMQKGEHMGKLVIKFPEQDLLPLVRSVPEPKYRSDASYLMVGGTGGLGRSIATWMASYGAKHFIFLSRSAGKSTADEEFFRGLKDGGCTVQCYAGDVADRELLGQVVRDAAAPIAGVLQMAMVLRDCGLLNMDKETWDAAVKPKVAGTWNLHELLPANLDFFVLFSSSAGVVGYYGQANYASANSFLDSFVQYRQSLGLAGTVINIGAIEDVGYVARTQWVMDSIAATSTRLMREQEFLDALQLAIARSTHLGGSESDSGDAGYCNKRQICQVPRCTISISDPRNTVLWKRDPRLAIYRNIEMVETSSSGGDASNSLKAFISSLAAEPNRLEDKTSAEMLAKEMAKQVSTFLGKDAESVDINQTLAVAGVDSLVAIELRNWWSNNLVVEVTVLELMNGGTMEQLGELAVQRLKKKYAGAK